MKTSGLVERASEGLKPLYTRALRPTAFIYLAPRRYRIPTHVSNIVWFASILGEGAEQVTQIQQEV